MGRKIISILFVCIMAFLLPACQTQSGIGNSESQVEESQVEEGKTTYSLDGKTFIFLGSSVTHGAASNGWSMCDYIQENYDCTVLKWAVSGTTLVDNGSNSYVQRMEDQIYIQEVMYKNNECDHFVCQLSTNDAGQNMPLGKVSDSTNKEDFDTSTTIGAMEYIIATAKEKWNCPVSFYTGTKYSSDAYQAMVNALYDLQDKWDIGIIDLWNDPAMNAVSQEDYSRYMADPVHPTKAGYEEWWGPKFVEHLQQYE